MRKHHLRVPIEAWKKLKGSLKTVQLDSAAHFIYDSIHWNRLIALGNVYTSEVVYMNTEPSAQWRIYVETGGACLRKQATSEVLRLDLP